MRAGLPDYCTDSKYLIGVLNFLVGFHCYFCSLLCSCSPNSNHHRYLIALQIHQSQKVKAPFLYVNHLASSSYDDESGLLVSLARFCFEFGFKS